VSPDDAHLDAETLAAWMDDGLDASSTAAAEAHVSNCERCQAMMAAFVRTEAPATVPLAQGTRAPGTSSLWRWWLAPIAATAAAVTIWMVMPPQTMEQVGQRDTALTVEQKADRAGAPPAPAERPAPAAEPPPQKLADNAATPPASRSRESASARAPSAEARQDRLSQDQNQDRNQAAGALADRVAKLEAAPRSADSAFSKPSEARTETPAPVALPETVAVAPAAPPALAAPAMQRRAGPFEVVSPSPAFRWRIDTRGSIERSEDGGRSWFPIRLGAGETIAAGSSPSRNICWVVGRGGLVLIAVDGVSFVRLPFPHDVDLAAVTATDGRAATVTAADGRTFTTSDSGRTWK
jgi:hypothetical protein